MSLPSMLDVDREAKRAALIPTGTEYRKGRMLSVKIDSFTRGAFAGNFVTQGVNTYNVHEADLPGLLAQVETATPDELRTVQTRYERACREIDEARRQRKAWFRDDMYEEKWFREVIGRDKRAFRSVEILDAIGVIE